MGNVRIFLFAALAGCSSNSSSNNNKTPDAPLKSIDAAIDAPNKVFMDAPPSQFDFSCGSNTLPTTAPAKITIAGTTETISMSGTESPVKSVPVAAFKSGTAAPIATLTSSATDGSFSFADVATGGVPLDGYLRAGLATYRTTYLYPPFPLAASTSMTPVIMAPDALFSEASALGYTQDDTTNGALLVLVTDCALTPMGGVKVKAQQNGADVGTLLDVGSLLPQAAGTYIVFNVPDGATQVSGTYQTETFPTHTVTSFKKPTGADAEGTVTATQMLPGPPS